MLETALVIAGVGVLAVLGLFALIRTMLYICPPNEVLVFSGRRVALADGTSRGYRTVFGGRAWRVPLIENVARMSLNVMEIPISIRGAYSKGGIPLNVDAIANVKISSDSRVIGNAIERFLGRGMDEIARVARETLEGHLRGVLATLTPEEVNEDRLKFGDELSHESETDLNKLGLHLDTLQIQLVSDDVQYLDSIGRTSIAQVIKDAEIAESDAKREAEQVEAENMGRANVIQANVDAAVVRMKNELRRVQAELESRVKSEEERTLGAAREARAKAEQELQEVRAQLEELRLKADRVLPAEAERVHLELRARGDAATIRERGKAVGEALEMLNQAWVDAGQNALSIYLIEDLEKILRQVAAGVAKVKVENLNMVDSGDGQTLAAYVSAYPAMLAAIFKAITDTTGIDIPKVISGGTSTNGAGGNNGTRELPPGDVTRPQPPARG
ncbi:MAG: flotillin family protein [Deltaproteobacteria bacterium]|nr:flotillin family protein [Deltaproteobacteria bacterium]